MRVKSDSPDKTEKWGVILGRLLRAGDLIFLSGDLGAGKTCFVRGLAEGIGADAPVSSPSFGLIRLYNGSPSLYHMDFYRLNSPKDLQVLDLPELFDEQAIFAIEWGDWVKPSYPQHMEIRIAYGEEEESRILDFEPHGERYLEIFEELKKFRESAGD